MANTGMYRIFKIFQENPTINFSTADLAEKTSIVIEKVRVYVYRLKKSNRIVEADQIGNVKLYRMYQAHDDEGRLGAATSRMEAMLGHEQRSQRTDLLEAELESVKEKNQVFLDFLNQSFELLNFLNVFFKQNVGYLAQNEAIMEFVQKNSDKFGKVEKLLTQGASILE